MTVQQRRSIQVQLRAARRSGLTLRQAEASVVTSLVQAGSDPVVAARMVAEASL